MLNFLPALYEVATLQDRVYRRLRDKLSQEIISFGINLSEWAILGQLHSRGSLTTTEIAALLDVEIPYITRMLKLLAEKELVAASFNDEDKRSRDITLTAKGKSLIEEIEVSLEPFALKLNKSITLRNSVNYYKALRAIDKAI